MLTTASSTASTSHDWTQPVWLPTQHSAVKIESYMCSTGAGPVDLDSQHLQLFNIEKLCLLCWAWYCRMLILNDLLLALENPLAVGHKSWLASLQLYTCCQLPGLVYNWHLAVIDDALHLSQYQVYITAFFKARIIILKINRSFNA